MYNLPNILTISRIIVIPVIFLAIYIHTAWWSVLTAILFIVAAVTDYLDGYLARSRNETSAFGRLLDPIADKLLVVSALLIIVANHLVVEISYIPVGIIMCREILVSGLREFLAEVKVGMPVTRLAKWKTAVQMTALSMILLSAVSSVYPDNWFVSVIGVVGEILLWVAGALTFMTGYDYFQRGLDYVKNLEVQKNKTNQALPAVKVAHETPKTKEKATKATKKAPKKKITRKTTRTKKVEKSA